MPTDKAKRVLLLVGIVVVVALSVAIFFSIAA
jgi:hypothetical protein